MRSMSQSFNLPLTSGHPDQIRFPDRCICCGKLRQADSTMIVSRLVMREGQQEAVLLRYTIPHCEKCHRSTKAIFLAGFLPFLAGFVLLGGAAFVVMTFYANALGIDQNSIPGSSNSLILGAGAGLAVGFVSGFLCEVMARILLLPFLGRGLWQAPLMITQFIHDADYMAGLSGKLDSTALNLQLTFTNDVLAHEFAALNPSAIRQKL